MLLGLLAPVPGSPKVIRAPRLFDFTSSTPHDPHDSTDPDGLVRPDPGRSAVRGSWFQERWQNGYCTRLESERPKGLGGSNPSRSVPTLQTCQVWGVFSYAEVAGKPMHQRKRVEIPRI